MSSPSIVNRDDTWPITVSAFIGKEHTEGTIDQTVDTWFKWRMRGMHVLIVDLTRGYAGGTATQRAHLAERVRTLLKATDPDENKNGQVALILVFDNSLVRGLITAMLWLVPTRVTPRMTGTMSEAVELAVAELKKVGVSVPSAAAERARQEVAASS